MTLEELDASLPNGLHDARIARIHHNFAEAMVVLELEILVALPEQPRQNAYRPATITFSKAFFCAVQVPENERILGVPGSVWFLFQRLERDALNKKVEGAIPDNALCYSLYVLDWEACINLAALDLSFEWSNP